MHPQSTLTLRACAFCGKGFRPHDQPGRTQRCCSKPCAKLLHSDGAPDRFWSQVNKDGPVIRPDLGPCWLWTGRCNAQGYGLAWDWDRRQSIGAHRIAYELTYGLVLPGIFVCHKCDNPPCCRPDHLIPGTHFENQLDCTLRGRRPSGERNGMRKHPERIARGERASHTKLTEPQIIEIISLRRDGWEQRAIADRFGVDRSTISRVTNRRTWTHLAS